MRHEKLSQSLFRIIDTNYELIGLIDIKNNVFELLSCNQQDEWNIPKFDSYDHIYNWTYAHIPDETQQDRFHTLFSKESLEFAILGHSIIPQTVEVKVDLPFRTEWLSFSRYDISDVPGYEDIFLITTQSITEEKSVQLELEAMHAALEGNYDFILSITAETDQCKCLYNSFKNSFPTYSIPVSYSQFVEDTLPHVHPEFKDSYHDMVNLHHLVEEVSHKNSLSMQIPYELDDAYGWYEISICRFHDQIDDDVRFLYLVRNITAQKEAEANQCEEISWALEQAKKANMAQKEFIRNVSHEIRTPLNGIRSMADLLLHEKNPTQDNIEKYSRIISESGNYLLRIINDLLDYSNLTTGTFAFNEESYEIKKLLINIQKMVNLKKTRSVNFSVQTDEMLPVTLFGDDTHLEHAIINVIDNAFKYTLGGNVTMNVSWENTEGGEGNLHIDVADTGIGIRDDDADNVFESFWQVQEKKNMRNGGLGMGLPISKMIIEHMGGTITFESILGEGSTFHIIVPQTVLDAKPFGSLLENEADLYAKQLETIRDRNFLVVDDNAMNLEVMDVILEELGSKSTTCQTGQEALNLLQQGQQFDLIFMDHFMPDMDGIETAKKIRNMDNEYCKKVPIIAFTANAVNDARKMYQDNGMDDLLLKPIDIKALKKLLQKWLPERKS